MSGAGSGASPDPAPPVGVSRTDPGDTGVVTSRRPSGPTTYSARSPFVQAVESPVETFAVGDRVTHDRFGLGKVIVLESAAVLVDFGAQRARVTSPFTRLTKI